MTQTIDKKMTDKVLCKECDWHGLETEMLRAPNPFDAEEILTGCPKCKSVGSLVLACDEPECWQESSCGTPTPSGYRRTCGKHIPEKMKK